MVNLVANVCISAYLRLGGLCHANQYILYKS